MHQLLRAPGSKVTYAPLERDGDGALNSWSMRTVPVKYSAGPLAEGCDPFFLKLHVDSFYAVTVEAMTDS